MARFNGVPVEGEKKPRFQGAPVSGEDLLTRAKASVQDLSDPTADMSTMQKLAAGAGSGMTDVARGADQRLTEMANRNTLGTIMDPGQMMTLQSMGVDTSRKLISDEALKAKQADVTETRRLEAPLMNTAAGKTGKVGGMVATALPASFIPGANTYTGSAMTGGILGFLQPTAEGESTALNTFLGLAGGAAGKYAGDKIAQGASGALSKILAKKSTQQSQNAVRDAAFTQGRQAGYVVPPSQARPSLMNRMLESFPGKAGVAQSASLKNQAVTNSLAKKALGIPDDVPLTEQTLKGLRTQAGKAYEAIKNAPGKLNTDQQFMDDIAKLGGDFSGAAEEFPDLVKNEAIDSLKASLSKKEITPKAAIEIVKKLRFDASKNFKSFDDPAKAALGKAQRAAADALDDLIERNLKDSNLDRFLGPGQQGAAESYRQARRLIAKTYDVEAALNESTGNVSAKLISKMLEKGKPLSGDMETIARFSRAFPRATQNVEPLSGVLGSTPLDWTLAGAGSLATGNPYLMATALARPVARSAIMSDLGQKILARPPSYGPPTVANLAKILADKDLTRQLMIGSGAAAALPSN